MSFTPSAATTRLLSATTGGNPTLPISAVWSNAGTTFTGIRFDVTDTASAAGSLLMDLRAGGVSQLSVSKAGSVLLQNQNALENYFGGLGIGAGWGLGVIIRSTGPFRVDGSYFAIGAAEDTRLYRDAADTLAQRRGVNAQTFRVYNTFTDASNYERGGIRWSGNRMNLFVESAGTGLSRPIGVGTTGSGDINFFTGNADRWYIVGVSGHFLAQSDNTYDIGSFNSARPRNLFLGSYMQVSEMTAPGAPLTNGVRIYAEDNGAGKTRLMALFATGAAQQIAIEP